MKHKEKQIHKIEQALRTALREQPGYECSPQWHQKVIRSIQGLLVQTFDGDRISSEAPAFRRIIFPFASATSFVAVALIIFVLSGFFNVEYDILGLVLEDFTGLFFNQLFYL